MDTEHTKLRAISFTNLAVDTHLRVLYRNELKKQYDCRLRPDFYYRHLKEIVSDSPWAATTVRDIFECLPYLFVSIVQFTTFREALIFSFQLLKRLFRKIRGLAERLFYRLGLLNLQIKQPVSTRTPDVMIFTDINDFASWVDERYVKPLGTNITKSVEQPKIKPHTAVSSIANGT